MHIVPPVQNALNIVAICLDFGILPCTSSRYFSLGAFILKLLFGNFGETYFPSFLGYFPHTRILCLKEKINTKKSAQLFTYLF